MTNRNIKSVLIGKLLLICSLFLLPGVMIARESKTRKITLMGLGDSITQGSNSFCSYLFPLCHLLSQAGYDVDFIGPQQSEHDGITINHAGFSGKSVEFLDSKIDSLYRLYKADVILLHAGHNHFIEEQPIPDMLQAYQSIIYKLQQMNPDVKILIAQVITSGKLPKYSYIPGLNKEIKQLVKRLDNPNVIVVNQAKGFHWKYDTILDKVHPNEEGAAKIANRWFVALKKVLERF